MLVGWQNAQPYTTGGFWRCCKR